MFVHMQRIIYYSRRLDNDRIYIHNHLQSRLQYTSKYVTKLFIIKKWSDDTYFLPRTFKIIM